MGRSQQDVLTLAECQCSTVSFAKSITKQTDPRVYGVLVAAYAAIA